jgi:hypothetical protein
LVPALVPNRTAVAPVRTDPETVTVLPPRLDPVAGRTDVGGTLIGYSATSVWDTLVPTAASPAGV